MMRPLLQANRLLIAIHMRRHGFSRAQTSRLVGRLGDGKIWEVIKKYGPIIFMVFIKYILPLLLVLEQPEGEPDANFELGDEMAFMALDQEELVISINDNIPTIGSVPV
jgi:hypothetical protein